MAKNNRPLTQQLTLKNPLVIFLVGVIIGWGASMVIASQAAPRPKTMGSGTCIGTPNPSAVGGETKVSASNLPAVDNLWFKEQDSGGLSYYGAGPPDANGNASVTINNYVTGAHDVEVIGQVFGDNRSKSYLLAKCSYMVQ